MKLKKVLAGVAASAMAAATMSVAANATIFVSDTVADGCLVGTGMWLVQVYNDGSNPEPGKPQTDYGIDLESISSIEFTITPHEFTEDFDFEFDGAYGGGVVMSCNGGTLDGDGSRNWNSVSWWGIDVCTDTAQNIQAVPQGNGVYTLTWDAIPDNYKFVTGAGCAQIALQEWGQSFVDLEVLGLKCMDASGNVVISFDGVGNVTSGQTNAYAAGAPVVDTTTAEATTAEDTATETPADTTAPITTPEKGSPDTGIEGVAAIAGIAVLAAGAVVLSKKRK